MIAVIISVTASCHRAIVPAAHPFANTEVKNENGQPMLLGHCSPDLLQKTPYDSWYYASFNSYAIDSATMQAVKPLLAQKRIEIFLGTWCGDSKREVPRMLKMLKHTGFDTTGLSLIFVSNSPAAYKQSPQHEEANKDIRRVPTLIVYDNAKEIGRIVESPVVSLEKDLLAILRGNPYKPKYAQN